MTRSLARQIVSLLPVTTLAVGMARAELVITVEGDCPDRLSFAWEGAPPNRRAVLLASAEDRGFQTQPGYPCGGVYLDIGPQQIHIVALFTSGPDGRGATAGRAPRGACGLFLQMVVEEGFPCEKSNVAQIPM